MHIICLILRKDNFCRTKGSRLICTVVSSQIWQWGRFVPDQVGIILWYAHLSGVLPDLPKDGSWVISFQLVVGWSWNLSGRGSIFHHLMRQFVKLKTPSEALSCVKHDLCFIVIFDSCNTTGVLHLFFGREKFSRVHRIKGLWRFRWAFSRRNKAIRSIDLSWNLNHQGLFFEFLDL